MCDDDDADDDSDDDDGGDEVAAEDAVKGADSIAIFVTVTSGGCMEFDLYKLTRQVIEELLLYNFDFLQNGHVTLF